MRNLNNKLINRSISGFTLLELSVVLMIVALVTASGLVVGKSVLESTQNAGTNNRLNAIETALQAFRVNGNRLPCPANGALAPSDPNFGKEAGPVGDCMGSPLSANYSAIVSGSKIVEGVVPVLALNLPAEFMYDGWGRKITYAVWAPMTDTRAFLNYGVTPNCGLLALTDTAGTLRSAQGNYVLVSHGPGGHGAFTAQGTKAATGSINPFKRTNCHCGPDGADLGYTGNYVMKDATRDPTNPLNDFDDIVRARERWQLQNYSDQNTPAGGLTCPQSLPGFRTDGVITGELSGASVSTGDINGDGIPDLIVGAPARSGNTGSVYVVFGTHKGFPDPLPLANLSGPNGFRIDGVAAGDLAGARLASKDINNDGSADIVIGAPGANGGTGAVFVVFGSRSAWPATFALSSLNGTNGIRLDGVLAGGSAGFSVASGDVNGDGYSDIIIGAPGANSNAGVVYTVFGSPVFARAEYTLDSNATTGIIDPDNSTNAIKGFRVDPLGSDDQLGYSLASGDTNGDGFADIVMGHAGYSGNTGLISMVRGKGRGTWSSPVKAYNLNGFNGWLARGILPGDSFSTSIAVGDVNGDGVGDIIVGAPNASPGGRLHAGAAYVLFGNNSPRPREFYTSHLNSYNGYEIDGIAAGDHVGSSVAVGDINGDAIGDVIIGANTAAANAGAVYVVFGAAVAPGITMNLSTLNGSNGFELDGALANDRVGTSLTTGDVNGDGRADVIAGASGSSHGGASNSGSTYVFFGQKKISSWTNYNLGGL